MVAIGVVLGIPSYLPPLPHHCRGRLAYTARALEGLGSRVGAQGPWVPSHGLRARSHGRRVRSQASRTPHLAQGWGGEFLGLPPHGSWDRSRTPGLPRPLSKGAVGGSWDSIPRVLGSPPRHRKQPRALPKGTGLAPWQRMVTHDKYCCRASQTSTTPCPREW